MSILDWAVKEYTFLVQAIISLDGFQKIKIQNWQSIFYIYWNEKSNPKQPNKYTKQITKGNLYNVSTKGNLKVDLQPHLNSNIEIISRELSFDSHCSKRYTNTSAIATYFSMPQKSKIVNNQVIFVTCSHPQIHILTVSKQTNIQHEGYFIVIIV